MRQRFQVLTLAFIAAVATVGLVGCGGGGSGGPSVKIYAQIAIAGVIQGWPNAILEGNDVDASPVCSYAIDSNCILTLGGSTNSSGYFLFQSDALPDQWSIGAEADNNCSTGASWTGTLSPNNGPTLTCGTIASGYITVSPSNCTITTNTQTGQVISNCPTTVTLKSPAASFPTAHALSYSIYSDQAKLLTSSSPTASSSTSISVPAPTSAGDTVLLLKDPNTKQVLGSALFTLNTKTINPCKNGANCGNSESE